MPKLTPILVVLLLICSKETLAQNKVIKDLIKVNYPSTRKIKQSDTYFGTTIDDPYRWLEDDQSEETER